MSDNSHLVKEFLDGMDPATARRYLETLRQDAEQATADEQQRQAEALRDLASQPIEDIEAQLDAMKGQPGYMADPKYRRLIAAHHMVVSKQVAQAQEVRAQEAQAQAEQVEARRAELMSELTLLQRGYFTSPEVVARQQAIRSELNSLPLRPMSSGKIDITPYLDGRRR